MGHLFIADVPPIIIFLAPSDSDLELEFYSDENLDTIPEVALNNSSLFLFV
jgi:hypothetical protein